MRDFSGLDELASRIDRCPAVAGESAVQYRRAKMITHHDPTTNTAEFRMPGREHGRHGAAGSRVPAGAETAVLAHEAAEEPYADRDPARRLAEVTRRFEAVRLAWAATRAAAARAERRAEATRTGRRSKDDRTRAAEAVAARVEARRLRREAAELFAELNALALEAAAAAEAVARSRAH